MTAGQFCTNKLFMEDLEKEIAERVGKALTDSLLTNPLVVDALQSDQKNGNSCWQQLFINEGLSLLKEQKEHKCLEMLRDISLGVAKNTIPLCGAFLQVAGVGKMLYELNNYTDDFIAKFNARVSSHQNDIIAAKNSAATKQAHREHIQAQETVTSAAPPIDLEEGDVAVHTLEEGTTYRSKIDEEKTQLQSTYNNLGPSTPSSLSNQFKIQIANKLTGSIKTNLVNPALTYAATSMTNKFFKETDKSIAALKNKVRTDRDCRDKSDVLAKAEDQTENNSTTIKGAKSGNTNNTPKEEKVPLSPSTASAVERAKNGEVKDGTDLGALSNAIKSPIYVYDKRDKLKYVVGDGLPGEPILLKHTPPTAENPHGHFAPMNVDVKVEQSGPSNCGLDAVFAQLSEAKKAELKDVNGLQEKMIETICNHPKEANDAYELRDKLKAIAPDKIISGGFNIEHMDDDDIACFNAMREGKYEVAAAIRKRKMESAMRGLKSVAPIIVGGAVTVLTGGTGTLPFLAGMGAYTGTAIVLDDDVRAKIIEGNLTGATDLSTYHFYLFGPGRHVYDAYKAGDKEKMAIYAGIFGLEAFGLGSIMKSAAGAGAQITKEVIKNEGKIVAEVAKDLVKNETKIAAQVAKVPTAGKGAGNAAKNSAQFEKLKTALAQQEISGAEVAGSALKKGDPLHRAASFVIDDIATKGKSFNIKGQDGLWHNLVQMPGEVNNKKGIFEWIVNAEGKLTHQRFIPDGKITGIPNQKVK